MSSAIKPAAKKLRPAVKWYGGKSYLARRIVALFPEHRTYVEPFAGGLSVLLNKPRTKTEVANDLNADLINFYMHMRAPGFSAAEVVYNRENFETAAEWLADHRSELRAIGFLVRNRFSRGGMGKDFAWSDRARGGQPGDVNAWQTIAAELPAIRERLRGVSLMRRDACAVIAELDGPDTLHYCDPPYLQSTRTARKVYDHEMTVDDHRQLLAALLGCEGKVFLSGYANPMYDDALAGWTRHEFSMPNHAGQGKTKQRRVECLWESP